MNVPGEKSQDREREKEGGDPNVERTVCRPKC